MSREIYDYLNQGTWWRPKDRPPIAIADMDERWRTNAARWLERHAERFELLYSLGELTHPLLGAAQMSDLAADGWDEAMEWRADDPAGWMRSTTLYRAVRRSAGRERESDMVMGEAA